jgi:adenylate cyclase
MILLICASIQSVHGQPTNLDSLKGILPSLPAIAQIKINYQIGTQFFDSSPDSAIQYFTIALNLSRATHNDTFAARCLNKIGGLNFNAGQYEKAIGNLFSALKIFELNLDKKRTVRCLQYLCMAYNEQGMSEKAIEFAKQSIAISRTIKDSILLAVNLTNLGSVYYSQTDYNKALEYFQEALHIFQEIKDQQGIADALNNVAEIYEKKKNSAKALEFHLKSLAMAKELNDSRGIAVSFHNIGIVFKSMEKFPFAIKYLDSSIRLAKDGNDKAYLKEAYNTLSEIYSDMGNFQKAYLTHLMFSNLNDTLMSEENKKQFAEMNTRYETEKKDNQIGLLHKDRDIQHEKMRKQQIIRDGFIGGFAVVLLFAGIFFHQRNKTKKEKRRSDELLLNILPSETAEELKAKGSAQAKYFDEVTVMFTDFKNFTQATEKLSATELVDEIHYCYSAFDRIVSKYNIEKIKTIGDSYMCAGGLPVPNNTNAEDTVTAALEIGEFMRQEQEKHDAAGRPFFEVRIGCHTGPVVAGIVGIKKFAYDIWGDTVNIASRMESSGEAGKVNISEVTYELVKDKFNCTDRGEIAAKNKADLRMYFVNRAVEPVAEYDEKPAGVIAI